MEDQVTNIAEILKDRPKGTKLYSTELGILRLIEVRAMALMREYFSRLKMEKSSHILEMGNEAQRKK